jgi:hypothetical protein
MLTADRRAEFCTSPRYEPGGRSILQSAFSDRTPIEGHP